MKNTEEIWSLVDAKERPFTQLSDRVWEMPELCYGEFRSCAEHTATLERQGFRVTKDVAGIPTAVVSEAGDGGPVIASSANTTRCRACRRKPVSLSRGLCRAVVMVMAAVIISWGPHHCWLRPR